MATLIVLITAILSSATTLLGVFYGPAWKDRIDARRAARQRSADIISHYSEPLAYAAFDLQSRLYNIGRGRFMWASDITPEYRVRSTLWVIGQFLAWIELVRRDVQIIDLGDLKRTAELQRRLSEVAAFMASTSSNVEGFPRIFRGEQRAIGELMVTERTVGEQKCGDAIGYAEFMKRLDEPRFCEAFCGLEGVLTWWMTQPKSADVGGNRLVLVQRALIDLIDFLDPEWVRFPDPDKRGKIPEPASYEAARRLPSRIAGFEIRKDPVAVLEEWATDHGLTATTDATNANEYRCALSCSSPFGRRRRQVKADLVMRQRPTIAPAASYRVEFHLAAPGGRVEEITTPPDDKLPKPLSASDRRTVNDLLVRFDRPAYGPGRLSYGHLLTRRRRLPQPGRRGRRSV